MLGESRLLEDIRNQPKSLAEGLAYHLQKGEESHARAIELIRRADRIVVTGMGASFYAGTVFECALSNLRLNSRVREAAEFLHYQQNAGAASLVIAISRSGETIEMVKLGTRSRALGSQLIAVTGDPRSKLASIADVVLAIPGRPDGPMAIQSYTGTLLTLLLLASRLRGGFTETRRVLETLIDGLPEYLATMLEKAPFCDGFFDRETPIHFLGRGPSYGSALEAAMLFNETARHPSVAMTGGNFRHGHIEVVDPQFRAVLFAPEGKTRDLDLALAHAIDRFGGKALVIGPRGDEHSAWNSIETPTIPQRFAPLVEIIPVQIAAAWLAAAKGLPVGTLRYIQPITRDEVAF
jgi:glucosamine--fructose-6-phosphate aminotransferase (isomerizing)